ncbi:MAG: zf-HC2 domain-containing protein [Clostridiales bacterium]|nr:zf-HC2 domain-containing protein [Clostridiales bacterium]
MKYDCDMISDLLPLYKDGICSESSRKIVEEHLEECRDCFNVLNSMNDETIDEEIIREKNEVIKSQAKFFKRKSAITGTVFAGIFSMPILVCFIVDLANGGGLSWFFIVLAAMLVPASLIVAPLMAPKNRMFTAMTLFTVSVLLLLGVIAVSTGGSWFFIAASAVLFGLTILFAPFIAARRPVNKYLGNKKGLAIMGAYTLTFVLMMTTIGLTVGAAEFFPMALAIAGPLLAVAWASFAIIRYLPASGLVKAGIVTMLISICSFLPQFLAERAVSARATGVVSYSTSTPGVAVIGLTVGAILLVTGIIIALVKGGKKNA